MLDYRLDDETEALRKTVREFAQEVIAPQIGEFYERDEIVIGGIDSAGAVSRELAGKLA